MEETTVQWIYSVLCTGSLWSPIGISPGSFAVLLFINNIATLELSDGSLILYADDLLLYRAISSDSNYELLQRDIDKLFIWSEENHLRFNPIKCKYLVVSRKQNPSQPTLNLNINSTILSKVEHIKYLGVWISENLSWSKHIDEICKNLMPPGRN